MSNIYSAGISKMVNSSYVGPSGYEGTFVEWLGGKSCVEKMLEKAFKFAHKRLRRRKSNSNLRYHYRTLFTELASLPGYFEGLFPRNPGVEDNWCEFGGKLTVWMEWYSTPKSPPKSRPKSPPKSRSAPPPHGSNTYTPPSAYRNQDKWWIILGVLQSASYDIVKQQYRILARKFHPDKGGDAEDFKSVSNAWELYNQTR